MSLTCLSITVIVVGLMLVTIGVLFDEVPWGVILAAGVILALSGLWLLKHRCQKSSAILSPLDGTVSFQGSVTGSGIEAPRSFRPAVLFLATGGYPLSRQEANSGFGPSLGRIPVPNPAAAGCNARRWAKSSPDPTPFQGLTPEVVS
jgi:hypothetical protein